MTYEALPGEVALHLAFGLYPSQLFQCLPLKMVSDTLVMLFPRWKYTELLSGIVCVSFALLWLSAFLSNVTNPETGMAGMDALKFEGVLEVFKKPNLVYVAWHHILLGDMLITRWIALDAVNQLNVSTRAHILLVTPCVLLSTIFAPLGLLVYSLLVSPMIRVFGFQQKRIDGTKEKKN